MRGSRVWVAAALALVTTLACAGCGFGLGITPGAVRLRVTEDFGTRTLGSLSPSRLHGSVSDLTLLKRRFGDVATVHVPYGKAEVGVTSIGGHANSPHLAWSLFVNGVAPTRSAAAQTVHKGDQVWFDLHDTTATDSIPAVVGAFPEPFTDGINGQRYPTTIECPPKRFVAECDAVIDELRRDHVVASRAAPGYGSGPDTLSINLGTWDELYGEVAAELIKYGPGASGVFAHFTDGGRAIVLENGAGVAVKTLGADSGLIAAVANSDDPAPTWLVAGTDPAGVRAAVRALTAHDLDGHFALAVHGSSLYPVPLTP